MISNIQVNTFDLECFFEVWQHQIVRYSTQDDTEWILEEYCLQNILDFWIDYGHFSNLKKLAISKMFHLKMPGYWFQFSTSNNTISLFDHWLVYRHCAKLLNSTLYWLNFHSFCIQSHCFKNIFFLYKMITYSKL